MCNTNHIDYINVIFNFTLTNGIIKNDQWCLKDAINDVHHVWCIPQDYSSRDEPWRYKQLANIEAFPMRDLFRFQFFDPQEVNDSKPKASIMMYCLRSQ